MKTYITYEDYLLNHPNSRQGFEVDKFSRDLVKAFLYILGAEDIIETTGNNSTDLIVRHPVTQELISCEIKDRSYKYYSTDFGDHFCELIKVQSQVKRKQNGEFNKLWLVSIFKDGAFAITTDLEHNIKAKRMMLCPETTTLGRNTYVEKECLLYNQDRKYYFCLFKDAETDEGYSFRFSDEPINVDELNKSMHNLF